MQSWMVLFSVLEASCRGAFENGIGGRVLPAVQRPNCGADTAPGPACQIGGATLEEELGASGVIGWGPLRMSHAQLHLSGGTGGG